MKTRKSRRCLAVFGVLGMGLTGVAAAWACSPNAGITSAVRPAAAPPGTVVTLYGERFVPNGEVEIRWNSSTGTLLATERGPDFTVGVRIPDVEPGAYTIVATGYREDRARNPEPAGQTSMSFEVRSPEQAETADPGAPGQPAGQTRNRVSAGSSSPPAPGTDTGDAPAASSPAASSPAASAASDRAAAPGAAPRTSPRAASAPASANPPVVTTPAGAVVFGGSLATPPASEQTAAPGRSATGDLWSGFSEGVRSPLALNDETAPVSGGDTSPVAVGMLLFGAGLVALSAGFGVAEMGRRRSLAQESSRLG